MPNKPHIAETAAGLRSRAERRAGKPARSSIPSEANALRLVHEVEVHQIELEMQNAELRIARDDAEAAADKYADLYDFAPIGYFTLTMDSRIRLVNLMGSTMVGIERSKLIDRSFAMLLPYTQRAGLRTFLNSVFADDSKKSGDFELTAGDAVPRIIKIEAQRSSDGAQCNMVVVDITNRRQAEDRVRISEIRYRRLFEAAHDGVLLLDPGTCRITDANPFMTRLLGYSRKQLIGKELFEIGLLRDEEASREMFRNLKKSHEVRYEDLPLEGRDGSHQEVEVVANLYQEGGHAVIQCNIRDITARKQVEVAMLRNQKLFSNLINRAPIGVHVVDAGFRLQEANPLAVASFHGVHPLIGRDFAQILRIIWPRRTANAIIGHFRRTLDTGEPYHSPAFTAHRRDTGETETYEWQTHRVILPAGEFCVVCFFIDTTERTKNEAARRRLEALTASNLKLRHEITTRRATEEALRNTRQLQSQLLKQSRLQQKRLRYLSHGILLAQEDERKRISRELHDVVAQTLVGINVHLAALNNLSISDPAELREHITSTHLLVEKSVDIVHRFARELRPTMLDDLGLIPALETFMLGFMETTGIRVSLKTQGNVEPSSSEVRTTIFRIAQEALTNVARHARASSAEVSIGFDDGMIRMDVTDNGTGFDPNGRPGPEKSRRLGLLGMKERSEMIGGTLLVLSKPGEPTTVRVAIPVGKRGSRKAP